ncbi:MAG: hypothetical protein DRO87_07575 [Candidatus Thorarchaeota archaeon]|nr:MAG: hypothetical protein DRO87_07575 [Candidatus Thorarchaeota archaeon]
MGMRAMTTSGDSAARSTIRIAGLFQEVRDIWVRRLDDYFNQLERLADGETLEASDFVGILRESRMASREALDGLGSDLSSELLHVTNGLAARYESERASLIEEINDLRRSLTRALSGDENSLRRENEALLATLSTIPEFQVLKAIEREGRLSYDELSKTSGLKKGKLRKLVKSLESRGHVVVNKKSRPHSITYLSAPWSGRTVHHQDAHGPVQSSLGLVSPLERS